MNRKLIDGKEIKVEFSKSKGGDRGGFRGGDRGGFRGGRDRDNGFRGGDRGPRRDFGDRPKGCFNCGKEGHMARDCSERNIFINFSPQTKRVQQREKRQTGGQKLQKKKQKQKQRQTQETQKEKLIQFKQGLINELFHF